MKKESSMSQQILSQAIVRSQPKCLPHPPSSRKAVISRKVPQAEQNEGEKSPTGEIVDRSLAAARDQAYREGFDVGVSEGHERGLRTGREQILAQTLEEARQQGYQQGLQQGREQGDEGAREAATQLQAALAQQKEQLLQLLQAIPVQLSDRLAAAEDDMVALVHACVLRLLGQSFQSGQGARMTLRQVMSDVAAHHVTAIRVHPDDFSLASDDAELMALREKGVSWEADRQVMLGGCFVDSRNGSLDARLETQLTEFTQLLLQVRSQTGQQQQTSRKETT